MSEEARFQALIERARVSGRLVSTIGAHITSALKSAAEAGATPDQLEKIKSDILAEELLHHSSDRN